MKKLLLLMACIPAFMAVQAQTCVGIYSLRLIDQKKKPVTEVSKNIWYVFTRDENEFYDEAEAVYHIDSFLNAKVYPVKHNAPGYTYFNDESDKSLITFPTRCGLYLIQTEFIRKDDTMRLALYNVPAHQSFQMDTLVFQKGEYVIDFQGSLLLTELEFAEDKGYFRVPPGVVAPFPKKKED